MADIYSNSVPGFQNHNYKLSSKWIPFHLKKQTDGSFAIKMRLLEPTAFSMKVGHWPQSYVSVFIKCSYWFFSENNVNSIQCTKHCQILYEKSTFPLLFFIKYTITITVRNFWSKVVQCMILFYSWKYEEKHAKMQVVYLTRDYCQYNKEDSTLMKTRKQ